MSNNPPNYDYLRSEVIRKSCLFFADRHLSLIPSATFDTYFSLPKVLCPSILTYDTYYQTVLYLFFWIQNYLLSQICIIFYFWCHLFSYFNYSSISRLGHLCYCPLQYSYHLYQLNKIGDKRSPCLRSFSAVNVFNVPPFIFNLFSVPFIVNFTNLVSFLAAYSHFIICCLGVVHSSSYCFSSLLLYLQKALYSVLFFLQFSSMILLHYRVTAFSNHLPSIHSVSVLWLFLSCVFNALINFFPMRMSFLYRYLLQYYPKHELVRISVGSTVAAHIFCSTFLCASTTNT